LIIDKTMQSIIDLHLHTTFKLKPMKFHVIIIWWCRSKCYI